MRLKRVCAEEGSPRFVEKRIKRDDFEKSGELMVCCEHMKIKVPGSKLGNLN